MQAIKNAVTFQQQHLNILKKMILQGEMSLFEGFFQGRQNSVLTDCTDGRGGNFQSDPFAGFGNKKLLGLEVGEEFPVRFFI